MSETLSGVILFIVVIAGCLWLAEDMPSGPNEMNEVSAGHPLW